MTTKSYDISCPDCSKQAKFEEAFEFVNKTHNDLPNTKHWGNWVVIERFPTVFPWKKPEKGQGFKQQHEGVLLCSNCHTIKKYRINWPRDAWWQWEYQSDLLWARDRQHAENLLTYIEKELRPDRRHADLKKLPAVFLSARARPVLVKKIKQKLEENSKQ